MLATLDNNMTTLQRLVRGGKVDVNYRDEVSIAILMLLCCILIYCFIIFTWRPKYVL